MDYAYLYPDPRRLYLNVTNRCTNRCVYCVRNFRPGLGDGVLRGGPEPDLEALLGAVRARGGAGAFEEIVWCGFGEPTFRLDLILDAAPHLRRGGARVRLDTNGHGGLIHGRDVVPELARAVDAVSVSLNAATAERYLELCDPAAGDLAASGRPPEAFWEATLDFLARAPDHFAEVTASVVGHVLDRTEIDAARALALRLGVTRFRVR